MPVCLNGLCRGILDRLQTGYWLMDFLCYTVMSGQVLEYEDHIYDEEEFTNREWDRQVFSYTLNCNSSRRCYTWKLFALTAVNIRIQMDTRKIFYGANYLEKKKKYIALVSDSTF
jgi:hypothetical protein